ncbi:hypothetical protein ARAF_2957 [Arsenophonus endosymbiont of Aleurodicus floccissimus]|uniref:hypothetical protein n=1 Tax=Arsenophonus endosymbiont of Aleurodicus floccissimus TaxID=2152761 RepID=UPI000E6AFA67|nr:hypothetical protein [Arsenophonus endosymbiont of Aleurodicus floccissimus]SPP32616.1 hypothetical protein ARAF_2957 [Arsenophonus endosymbiont of Aleurodicus floccissimus]
MNGKVTLRLKNPFTAGAVAIMKVLKQQKSLLTMMFLGMLMLFPAMRVYADPPTTGGFIQWRRGGGEKHLWQRLNRYLVEILAAIFAYVKTKNLAVFGGIAAVIVFVNVVFGLI